MIDDEPMTGGHKANFDDIYDQPDPRAYFRTLAPLDYQIPQQARPVIERVHAAAGADRTILDVCCSYGINAALLRFDLDIADLAARYTDAGLDAVPPPNASAPTGPTSPTVRAPARRPSWAWMRHRTRSATRRRSACSTTDGPLISSRARPRPSWPPASATSA